MDFLEATIVICFSVFAYIYCEISIIWVVLRLFQLIRYKNKIMFVTSKIVYLKKRETSSIINHIQLYSHIITLNIILDNFELAFKFNYSYFLDDVFILNLIFRNISVIFQIAIKIYFYSIIDSKNKLAISSLINYFILAIYHIF